MNKNKASETRRSQAISARNFLSFLMVAIILAAGVGFYFGYRLIKQYADEVNKTVTASQSTVQSPAQLDALKKQVAERQALVAKSNQLFTTSDNYQTQALKDVQAYASQSGVTITNTEFSKLTTATAPTTASSTPQTAATNSIVVSLKSPVSYDKLLHFLHGIENNLPKLQVTGLVIGRPNPATGDSVTVDKITITVATN